MKYDIAFIGVGKMGGAVCAGACRAFGPERVAAFVRDPARRPAIREQYGCAAPDTAAEAAREAGIVVLCMKPHQIKAAAEELAPVLAARETPAALVSIAAGVTLAKLREYTSPSQPLVRVMPNLPALIGRGMMLWTAEGVSEEAGAAVVRWLEACGEVRRIEEKLMDAGSATAACSPAFAAMFIEALADGGVLAGLSRADATALAAAALEGTAAMVLAGSEPAKIKDDVCSPGGSTIEGVLKLEQAGMRAAVTDALIASWRRSSELG